MHRKFILGTLATASFFVSAAALAQEAADPVAEDAVVAQAQASIVFPIAELGNCASRSECKTYCDIEANASACISYAETHKLMKKDQVVKARVLIEKAGPGGCKGAACKAYCAQEANKEACFTFAKENGLIRAEEAKVIQDIRLNGGPGGCKEEKECRAYCSDSANAETCRTFAEVRGLKPLKREDGDVVRVIEKRVEGAAVKIRAVLQQEKAGPGGCTSPEACREYCSAAEHQEECIAFAKKHQIISEAEAEKTLQFRAAIRAGGPGGCTDPQSCKEFCGDPANREACVRFAEENALMVKGILMPPGQGEERRMKMGSTTPGQGGGILPNVPNLEELCAKYPERCAALKEQIQNARKVPQNVASSTRSQIQNVLPKRPEGEVMKPRPAPMERKQIAPYPGTVKPEANTTEGAVQ